MYNHSFEGPIERFGVGKTRKVWYTVLYLPAELEAELPFDRYPRLRVDGEIADVPVTGAWMPTGNGRRYFIVAPRVITDGAVTIGSTVEMRFAIAAQNAVDVPPALAEVLLGNPEAREAWDALTPGKQRGMTHQIHGARTAPTRARRVADAIKALMR